MRFKLNAGYNPRDLCSITRPVRLLLGLTDLLWVTFAPPFWVAREDFYNRFCKWSGGHDLLAKLWIAVIARNPEERHRLHLHALVEYRTSSQFLIMTAKWPEIAGNSRRSVKIEPAIPYHAKYLLDHLDDDDPDLRASRAMFDFIRRTSPSPDHAEVICAR